MPPEQRARQAALIRHWRPWERSTGPKTPQGKARVARNAFKGGVREQLRSLARVLRAQERALRSGRQRPKTGVRVKSDLHQLVSMAGVLRLIL